MFGRIAFVSLVVLSGLGCRVSTRSSGLLVGHTEPVEKPPVDDNRTLVTRDLGAVDGKTCDPAAFIKQGGARCRHVVGVQATGSEPTTSATAFDGDMCTTWNGKKPAPGFVAVDFGAMRVVTDLLLVT